MSETSSHARDLLIRRLYDERHELLRIDRVDELSGPQSERLKFLEARINRLEMDEYEEHEGPAHRERMARLCELVLELRPHLSPESQAKLDAMLTQMAPKP